MAAEEQAELQKKHDALKLEVEKRDQDIKRLQKNLKEAENILVSCPGVTFTLVTHEQGTACIQPKCPSGFQVFLLLLMINFSFKIFLSKILITTHCLVVCSGYCYISSQAEAVVHKPSKQSQNLVRRVDKICT